MATLRSFTSLAGKSVLVNLDHIQMAIRLDATPITPTNTWDRDRGLPERTRLYFGEHGMTYIESFNDFLDIRQHLEDIE